MAPLSGIKGCFEFLSALAFFLCLIAAPGIVDGGDQGVLEIQIKDHRAAIGDFAKLEITIDKIAISPRPGLMFWRGDWKDLVPTNATIDLTHYIGKKTARVLRASMDAGAFEAFDLKLKRIKAVLKQKARTAAVKNALGPVKLPFEVPPGGETVLILDLVVTDFSDHPPRGYELGIGGYELLTNGKLVAKIPPG